MDTSPVRATLGGDSRWLPAVRSALTYLNAAAAFAFVPCHFGPGWRSSLRWVARVYFAFASIAVAVLFVFPDREVFLLPYRIAVVVALAVIYANAFTKDVRKRPGSTFLAAACIGGIVFFTLETLRELDLISFDITTDWTRGLIFYCTLGILVLAMRYFFVQERDLALIRQELDTARKIQASILPRATPAVSGLDIAARYVPMTEVAGDFYDFIEPGPSRLGVLVADVSGHGVSAALIASMVKVAFQAQAECVGDPARVLEGMNRIFAGQFEGQFITAVHAFLDLEAARLSYAGAAHPPLFFRAAETGKVEHLTENGLMLGPFPDVTYTSANHRLKPGDRVVMTTDGLIEAQDKADRQFGDERLQHLLETTGDLSAAGAADRLLAEVQAWTGERQDDDLTLVVIDVRD
jgi:hypothetical protein